jgi:hypothetical protein
MDQVGFWIDNLRAGLIIAILYIIKTTMQRKSDQKFTALIRKLEKENIILHHRLEKLIKGEKK